jgi:nitrite reductase/ring-hydroxylating ferredoxin subunit
MSEPRSPETCYRGDYARVTTPERNITIKLSHEEFAMLDACAHKEYVTRTALDSRCWSN